MRKLPPKDSLALTLFYLEEYSLKESIRYQPVGHWLTPKVILHRARKSLRAALRLININTMQEDFEDEQLSSLIHQSKRTLNNAGFEQQVMLKIQEEATYRQAVANRLRASLRLFVIGVILGTGSVLYVMFTSVFSVPQLESITIISLFTIGVLAIMIVSNYQRLIHSYTRFNLQQ